MLEYLWKNFPDCSVASTSGSSQTGYPTILDVGTGNGSLLFRLCGVRGEDDYSSEEDEDEDQESGHSSVSYHPITPSSHLCGVDYSPASIQLCKDIVEHENAEATDTDSIVDVSKIEWKESDLCDSQQAHDLAKVASSIRTDGSAEGGWDIVLDKGTLDAIALAASENGTATSKSSSPLQQYLASLATLTCSGNGLLLITSCNFTAEELVSMVTSVGQEANKAFVHLETLPSKKPVFQFGGKQGNTTVCIAFRRV